MARSRLRSSAQYRPIRDRRLSRADSGALVYLVFSEKQPAKGPITSYVIQRTDDEIDQVLNLAHDPEERGGTAGLGMSFERGVEWTLGLGNGVPRCPEEGP